MEVIRYKYVFILITLSLSITVTCVNNTRSSPSKMKSLMANTTTVCPFTKIIEDIFKIRNKSSETGFNSKESERAKIFLNSIANVTINDEDPNVDDRKSAEDKLVNDIIASINRIKSNLTDNKNENEVKLNEAIILTIPKDIKNLTNNSDMEELTDEENGKRYDEIKSGIEDRIDALNSDSDATNEAINKISDMMKKNSSQEETNFVEILTIEPNNTSANNTSSHNIIEVLKQLMPLFNSSLTKELHNITIIERNFNKNHSFTATKNVSTIVVTYCDKQNLTKANVTFDSNEIDLKNPTDPKNGSIAYDYYMDDTNSDDDYIDIRPENLTVVEKKDILEAAEYGMQKMHELFSVLEPKLYSMGLWLDDTNPARYVAAFNAPSEDMAKYSRYGYASLQAAARLKELTSGGNEDGIEGRTEEAQFPAASALRQSPLLQHCPLKGAPKCPPASKRYRTHDGTCNNLNRPRWGSTMTPVQRFLAPSYSDGIQAPRRSITGATLPSAREISALIHEDQNIENHGITHLLMQWGQFLDHDVTSSSQSRGFNGSVPRCCQNGGRGFVPKEFLHPECLPITVPPSDPFYGPRGVRCLDFVRSSPAPRDDCALGWREQLNQVSAYIDGSPVYASSARQSDKLRLFRNGMLQYGRVQQRRPVLPPERRDELCRGGAVSTECFKSGDGRVNEHPGLVAAHIVWLRQHNRMAQELAHLNPNWSDEKIYQETRKIIGAMIQHITYREFLPIVLGSEVIRLFELELQKKGYYRGYDPKINASPASSFGSAAFRFGHSLVQPSLMRYDRFHRPIHNNVSLHNEPSNPSNIWSMGAVDRLLLGMVNQPIQKRDEFITEELTNHLFQTPQFDFGMDLAAINIQRGRDHGMPPYTTWREPCGLSAILGFEDLLRVMPARTVKKLQALYRDADDIDLFTGGMAERPVVGGLVGPTFACIIAQQFSNLRKGDRFWYENGGSESSFTPAQLQQIRRISFAQILCRTLDTIDSIQPFVFLASENSDNGRISCQNGLLNDFDLSPWTEINSEFNNDISKSDDDEDNISTQNHSAHKPSTQRPKRTKSTTTIRPTTKKTQKITAAASNKVINKKPAPANVTNALSKPKPIHRLNLTDMTVKDKDSKTETLTVDINGNKSNVTVQNIDDKLDFKYKSRRNEDSDRDRFDTRRNNKNPTKQYNDYDDEDNVQSVQSVVINNLSHKRPTYNNNYNRPVITVTENVDKYTYLINYVPRPTESWRQTTRKTYDRDVVKVTYQTYDDTYRRPNKPYYYNRQEEYENENFNSYRRNRPNPNTYTDMVSFHSSARSNDEIGTTNKPKETIDKSNKIDNINPTTDNFYKLVTFGYVGTYKGNKVTNDKVTKADTTDKKSVRYDTISKDFSTYDLSNDGNKVSMKLSTFFIYDTVTKPYSKVQRPTRRHDEDRVPTYLNTNSKYYYVKNILHKYSERNTSVIDKPDFAGYEIDNTNDNDNYPLDPANVKLEERSSADKLAFLEEVEKSANPSKLRIKIKEPAKTPSVAFQIIPSENNPAHWAVYEENANLPEGLPLRMPSIMADPHALKEIPRPIDFINLRKRRPGRF